MRLRRRQLELPVPDVDELDRRIDQVLIEPRNGPRAEANERWPWRLNVNVETRDRAHTMRWAGRFDGKGLPDDERAALIREAGWQ